MAVGQTGPTVPPEILTRSNFFVHKMLLSTVQNLMIMSIILENLGAKLTFFEHCVFFIGNSQLSLRKLQKIVFDCKLLYDVGRKPV